MTDVMRYDPGRRVIDRTGGGRQGAEGAKMQEAPRLTALVRP
ncbi:MAG: hypothetical protein ACUVQK_07340 [Thermogutta sp.]